jgi:hypothetical protein
MVSLRDIIPAQPQLGYKGSSLKFYKALLAQYAGSDGLYLQSSTSVRQFLTASQALRYDLVDTERFLSIQALGMADKLNGFSHSWLLVRCEVEYPFPRFRLQSEE